MLRTASFTRFLELLVEPIGNAEFEANGVRTVIVEDASRFARELMAQELGITLLISRSAVADGLGR